MTTTKLRAVAIRSPEVRQLLDTGEVLLVRPVKPQPSDNEMSLYGHGIIAGTLEHYETGAPAGYGFESEDRQWRCPCGAPGCNLYVQERWRWYGRDRGDGREGGIQYMADLAHRTFTDFDKSVRDEVCNRFIQDYDAYVNTNRSPSHLVRLLSRLTVVNRGVEVRRNVAGEYCWHVKLERVH